MILLDPQKGKALKEELAGLHRISKKHVEIVALGPRQKIYEETFLVLKREGSIRN